MIINFNQRNLIFLPHRRKNEYYKGTFVNKSPIYIHKTMNNGLVLSLVATLPYNMLFGVCLVEVYLERKGKNNMSGKLK